MKKARFYTEFACLFGIAALALGTAFFILREMAHRFKERMEAFDLFLMAVVIELN